MNVSVPLVFRHYFHSSALTKDLDTWDTACALLQFHPSSIFHSTYYPPGTFDSSFREAWAGMDDELVYEKMMTEIEKNMMMLSWYAVVLTDFH